jgi:hypothetical protein
MMLSGSGGDDGGMIGLGKHRTLVGKTSLVRTPDVLRPIAQTAGRGVRRLFPSAAHALPGILAYARTQELALALTFGDGLHPECEMRLVAILDKYQAGVNPLLRC